jgi:hypothetical protein
MQSLVGGLEIEALEIHVRLLAADAAFGGADVEHENLRLGIHRARQPDVQLAALPTDDHRIRHVVAVDIRNER